MNILVIDAQGGGIGRQLVMAIRKSWPEISIMAVGANTTATNAMLKAGATRAATGENAVVVSCRKADIIIGPVGIVIADSMYGEITPAMAKAVAQADAKRILIPFNSCENYLAGISDFSTGRLIDDALRHLSELLADA